jgi:NAD(P)-dependent dehydrogenase (short-subunit alcohol dehydrogenase family)
MSVLAGKTAFVTGGAGGIGSASAKTLVKDGAAALIMGRRKEALEETRARFLKDIPGAKVEIFAGDARKEDDVKTGLQKAYDIQKRLDIIVPTIGGASFKPLLMMDAQQFRDELDFNIISAFLAIRYGVPMMENGGSVVCISSNAGKIPFGALAGYHSSKAGLEGFIRAAAEELGSAGVRVNAVRPGLIRNKEDNPMFTNESIFKEFAREYPLRPRAPGRLGENDDIGAAVRYLAGPESSWVTGQSFAVDGGQELRKNPDLSKMIGQMYGEAALDAVRRGKSP